MDSSSPIRLLPTRLDDPSAVKLIAKLMAEMEVAYPESEPSVPCPPHEFASPSGLFLVAWAGDQAVGCGGFRSYRKDIAEVKRMYVEPWARGRGISRLLLQRLEEESRRLGYTRIRLETGTRQPEAMGLYETSGYTTIVPYGEFRDSPLSVCYEKSLS